MSAIVERIRQELIDSSDAKTLASVQRYFKEEAKAHGVKTATAGAIATKYRQEIKGLGKDEIFSICEELLKSDFMEEAFVVAYWLPKFKNIFEPGDMKIFRDWIDRYINNWAKCDGFCNHTIGIMIQKFPELVSDLKSWAHSRNRWMKRAAAVSLIVLARKGDFFDDVIEIAKILLTDKDDMVQKGYGWMLKEASKKHEDEVLKFVLANKRIMPRTALRYAIEKMPKEKKDEAMKKEG